ncbi:hypothetical protein AYR66_12865 [Noviherbaspirillum denitrificans]|uniref:Uncharacterized protein n=1 Tax=Noviherbaspirillum denitrificans TaxID=1968433 RepID=A0A254TG07_9BURK|nr:hypothetical protein AYR66_12865 [Noviherbaspirillum denitrificans]
MFCRNARHVVAGRDQAVDHAVPCGALADRVNIRIGTEAVSVDRNAAARAKREAALARKFITRTNTGGEDQHVRFEVRAIREYEAVTSLFAVDDFERVLLRVHADAQLFDLLAQHAAAAVVHLHRHQARCEFDHVRVELHVAQCLGALQAKQAAADDDTALGAGAALQHRFQVFDSAVDKAVLAVLAGHRRNKGIGAGCHDQLVIGKDFAARSRDGLVRAVDRGCLAVQLEQQVVAVEETG